MLPGITAFVIEAEFIIALEIQQVLEGLGARVELGRPGQAPDFATLPDLVVMDARLGAPDVVALCRQLVDAGVAVVVTSGDREIGTLFGGATLLEKPFGNAQLLAACTSALALR